MTQLAEEVDLAIDSPEAALAGPLGKTRASQVAAVDSLVSIFGVRIANLTENRAMDLVKRAICEYDGHTRSFYFVNAHTLNIAARRLYYRELLNRAYCVFGDGTGVRWAARSRGVRMQANLNGTDLVPRLFQETSGQGYRYFLLGATADTISRAAASASHRFGGWTLAGCHHGYINKRHCSAVIDQINEARPHLLLVGMGNPIQERWIDRHRKALRVPVCMGTGGLFDHWAGNLRRAPRWVRRLGYEWVQLLLQQPHKWRRYLLGNPTFVYRIFAQRRLDLALVADFIDDCEWRRLLEVDL